MLARFRGQQPGASPLEAALAGQMQDDGLAAKAEAAVEKGEALMDRLSRLQGRVFDGVLEHIESEDVESKVLEGISRFNPDMFLADLELAAADRSGGMRQTFVNQLLDQCLSGLLAMLPGVRVPEVSGTYRNTAYTCYDLDMGGLKFRKEDVHVALAGLAGAATAATEKASGEVALLFARDVAAEFPRLRCTLKPKMLPKATVVTTARAAGITICLAFATATGTDAKVGDLVVSRLQVTMEKLDIALDKGKCAPLFNPIVAYLNTSLKAYICRSLEVRLAEPAVELCAMLESLLKAAAPLLRALAPPATPPSVAVEATMAAGMAVPTDAAPVDAGAAVLAPLQTSLVTATAPLVVAVPLEADMAAAVPPWSAATPHICPIRFDRGVWSI
eukprot:NODE_3315_length_2055_cov_2.512967.p1 GENE.NODE_3315_length_2055_cov_2.512967~~NODE_3315_length_2055_cov_2.512967.p1  ORF type:complete len:389 (-),score=133.07 NODE_3315_length_2055_cov_2.512967:58-1224(-)